MGILASAKLAAQRLVNPYANPPTYNDHLIIDLASTVGVVDQKAVAVHFDGTDPLQVHGVILRASNGKYPDSQFYINYKIFKNFGVPVGAYGVLYPRSTAAANKKQAFAFLAQLDLIGEVPELWEWGDYEVNPDNLDVSTVRWAIGKYIITVEEYTQRMLGVYTNYWWDKNVANPTNGNTDIPRYSGSNPGPGMRWLWAASWSPPPPYVTYDWKKRYGSNGFTIHQYNKSFRLKGIPGTVDANYWNGGISKMYQMLKLDGQPQPPPTPEPPPGEELMKYTVIKRVAVRKGPGTNYGFVRMREVGEEFVAHDTKGDTAYPGAYWAQDPDGNWSAAEYYGGTVFLDGHI